MTTQVFVFNCSAHHRVLNYLSDILFLHLKMKINTYSLSFLSERVVFARRILLFYQECKKYFFLNDNWMAWRAEIASFHLSTHLNYVSSVVYGIVTNMNRKQGSAGGRIVPMNVQQSPLKIPTFLIPTWVAVYAPRTNFINQVSKWFVPQFVNAVQIHAGLVEPFWQLEQLLAGSCDSFLQDMSQTSLHMPVELGKRGVRGRALGNGIGLDPAPADVIKKVYTWIFGVVHGSVYIFRHPLAIAALANRHGFILLMCVNISRWANSTPRTNKFIKIRLPLVAGCHMYDSHH